MAFPGRTRKQQEVPTGAVKREPWEMFIDIQGLEISYMWPQMSGVCLFFTDPEF